MSKTDRRDAELKEYERRAANSGVPSHMRVYEISTHYCDAGGPLPLVPNRVSEHFDSDNEGDDPWQALIEAARTKGTPIAISPDDYSKRMTATRPLADICMWDFGEYNVFLFSDKAIAALGTLLEATGRRIPVTCKARPTTAYEFPKPIDAINIEESNIRWGDPKTHKFAMDINKLVLHSAPIKDAFIFELARTMSFYVRQPFVALARAHNLTGLTYKLAWPKFPIVYTVPVPAIGKAAKPDFSHIKFSIEKTPVKNNSAIVELLTAASRKPLKLPTLLAIELPPISVPTGSLITADVMLTSEKPLARKVPPGKYALTLIIAREHSDERIAFSLLRFSNKPIAKWEPAVFKGALKKKEPVFGVDSGTATIGAAEVQELLHDAFDADSKFAESITKQMGKSSKFACEWIHIETPKGSAAIFSSGVGDGAYGSHFALDAKGNPVLLLTDFGMIEDFEIS